MWWGSTRTQSLGPSVELLIGPRSVGGVCRKFVVGRHANAVTGASEGSVSLSGHEACHITHHPCPTCHNPSPMPHHGACAVHYGHMVHPPCPMLYGAWLNAPGPMPHRLYTPWGEACISCPMGMPHAACPTRHFPCPIGHRPCPIIPRAPRTMQQAPWDMPHAVCPTWHVPCPIGHHATCPMHHAGGPYGTCPIRYGARPMPNVSIPMGHDPRSMSPMPNVPCGLETQVNLFAVADWISKLTWVSLYVLYSGKPQRAPRARTRAGDHGHPLV